MNGDGNFKMKCIDTMGVGPYTQGKIYEVENGQWYFDDGDISGSPTIKTIDNVNEWSTAKWELVEENPVKERIETIAKMLGVELNEKFNMVFKDGSLSINSPYKFTEQGLFDKDNDNSIDDIGYLMIGDCTIEKLPWKPKNGDEYYYVELWDIPGIEWGRFNNNNLLQIALYKCGWMFRTKEEAEANKERVLKEMKEVIGK